MTEDARLSPTPAGAVMTAERLGHIRRLVERAKLQPGHCMAVEGAELLAEVDRLRAFVDQPMEALLLHTMNSEARLRERVEHLQLKLDIAQSELETYKAARQPA